MSIAIGMAVEVQRDQAKTRLGPPKCPGRTGVVVRRNSFGDDLDGGLWYVQLEATTRSKPREEAFWGDELRPVQ